MNETQSKKTYRGSKFLILVIFLLGIVGVSYYSATRPQGDSETAGKNPAVDALVASVLQQSEEVETGTAQMPVGSNEQSNMYRDRRSMLGTTSTQEAGQVVDSAAAAGSAVTGMAEALAVSAQDVVDGVDSSLGAQATGAMDTAKADVETAFDSGSSAVSSVDIAGKQVTDGWQLVEIPASATLPDREATNGPVSASAKTGALPSLHELSAMGEKNLPSPAMFDSSKQLTIEPRTAATGQAMDPAVPASDNTGRCIGPAPMGKDLGDRYIVAECETLSMISERTDVDLDALIQHNPQVSNPDRIYPMQRLWLPPRT